MKIKIVKSFKAKSEKKVELSFSQDLIKSYNFTEELKNALPDLQNAYYFGAEIVIEVQGVDKKTFQRKEAGIGFEFINIDLVDLPKYITKIGKYSTNLLVYNKLVLEKKRPSGWLDRVKVINSALLKGVDAYNRSTISSIKQLKNVICNQFAEKLATYLTKARRTVQPYTKKGTRPTIAFNPKMFLEIQAELEFEADTTAYHKYKPLSEKQRDFLRHYAVPFGVVNDISEVGTRNYSESLVLTDMGYAEMPSVDEVSKDLYYDETDKSFIRSHTGKITDTGLERVQFDTLLYIMKNAADLPNYGLVAGYTVCPVCGEIMKELDACPNGCIEAINTINLDSDLSDYIDEEEISCDITGNYNYTGFAEKLTEYFDRHPKLKDVLEITQKFTEYLDDIPTKNNK